MRFGKLPAGLSFWHPVSLICTWFGSGLLPGAPGTWGSLATLPVAWLIATRWGSGWLLIAAALALAAGLWAASRFLRHADSKDPGIIVIDETAGQFLALAAVPPDPVWFAAGFVLFRIADIAKPWPASWADRRLPGAVGVMIDDVFAGAYVLVLLYAAQFLTSG